MNQVTPEIILSPKAGFDWPFFITAENMELTVVEMLHCERFKLGSECTPRSSGAFFNNLVLWCDAYRYTAGEVFSVISRCLSGQCKPWGSTD